MGSFKNKGGGGGGAAQMEVAPLPMFQTTAQENALKLFTPKGLNTNLANIGGTSSFFDQGTGTIQSTTNLDPLVQAALVQNQQKLLNFDSAARREGLRAQRALYQPLEDQATAQLGTMFSGLGVSGKRNSMAQAALARLAEEQTRNKAAALYDAENQGRNRILQELQTTSGLAYRPAEMLFGLTGQQAGQVNANQVGLGQSLADLYNKEQESNIRSAESTRDAQMRAQEFNAQQKALNQKKSGSGLSGLLGGGLSLLTSFLPVPKWGS